MLHSFRSLSAVDIRSTKFPCWCDYYLCLHCQEIGWWECYFIVYSIDDFNNKRSWIHDCLDFDEEGVQWLIIQTSTVCLLNLLKYSKSRPYLCPRYTTHITCRRRVHLPLYPISTLFQEEFFLWCTLQIRFLAPTKFPPLLQRINLTFTLLAMNRLNARIDESVSKVFVISTWITRLAKYVKWVPYCFKVVLLSLISNGPNMPTPK